MNGLSLAILWRVFLAGGSGYFSMLDSPLRATNLSGNINNIRTLLAHLLYHVKVLSAQHECSLCGVGTLRKQHVGGVDNPNGELLSYIIGADIIKYLMN